MCDSHDQLTQRYSLIAPRTRSCRTVENFRKSDLSLPAVNKFEKTRDLNYSVNNCSGEYYKKYEYDELPVKEYKGSDITVDTGRGDTEKNSLNNSDLEKLEITSNNETQITSHQKSNEKSISTLDSNVNFFKESVQEIFDNFNTSKEDLEVYTERFNQILANKCNDCVFEMEQFIKDILRCVLLTSETMTQKSNSTSLCERDTGASTSQKTDFTSGIFNLFEVQESVMEAYRNELYVSDSAEGSAGKVCKRDYLLPTSAPRLDDKMINRNFFSAINVIDERAAPEPKITSVDNLNVYASKQKEKEEMRNAHESDSELDNEIPVKHSRGENDITLATDLASNEKTRVAACSHNNNNSFLSKICSFFCKKLRRHTIS